MSPAAPLHDAREFRIVTLEAFLSDLLALPSSTPYPHGILPDSRLSLDDDDDDDDDDGYTVYVAQADAD